MIDNVCDSDYETHLEVIKLHLLDFIWFLYNCI